MMQEINEQTIKAELDQAIQEFFKDQPSLFKFTSETGVTEWDLAHHLSSAIHKHFKKFDCDVEVTKKSSKRKRPDIILHKRGTHDSNFLVIEVKYDSNRAANQRDVKKILTYWFSPPLLYQFGAVVHLKRNQSGEVLILKNPCIA